MNKFLFELGTEEIPADMIAGGLEQLSRGLRAVLEENGVEVGAVSEFSSPRRLAVLIEGLPERQEDREETVQGPPRSIAFDDQDQPTAAARGFAGKVGVAVQELEVAETDRGEYLVARRTVEGLPVPDLLARALPAVVGGISWPKTMVWTESRFRFIRPLRWLLALWNGEVLDFELEGVHSGRSTHGHRFLGGGGPVEVAHPDGYVEALRQHFVLVDLEERRAKIARELQQQTPEGSSVLPDPDLERTVAFLNEFPTVLRGGFQERFLEIPREVLVTVMRHHQKYFALVDAEGRLQPWFLTVLNTEADAKGNIRKGHERVLEARLEDAAFFWNTDRQKPLAERVEALAEVMFQKELGSYLQKTERIRAICAGLADDPRLDEAARLCKADLTCDMVFEMPELQGIMGGLYARAEGLPEPVWKAIYEHYRPLAFEDDPPQTRAGALLSLADRADTVVGCFSAGIRPTSSSDPFGLRRQAQGAVQILLEHRLEVSLGRLLELAARGFEGVGPDVLEQVREIFEGRVRYVLREKGFDYDVLNAVFAAGVDNVYQASRRCEALQGIRGEADFEALAVAFKRMRNILTKETDELPPLREDLLAEKAESNLYQAFSRLQPGVDEDLEAGNYAEVLRALAGLRAPVDRFFDDVMVLTEEADLRRNRLRLLTDLSALFLQVADISEVVVARPSRP